MKLNIAWNDGHTPVGRKLWAQEDKEPRACIMNSDKNKNTIVTMLKSGKIFHTCFLSDEDIDADDWEYKEIIILNENDIKVQKKGLQYTQNFKEQIAPNNKGL